MHGDFVALSDFCPLMDFHCSSFCSVFIFISILGTWLAAFGSDALGSAFARALLSNFCPNQVDFAAALYGLGSFTICETLVSLGYQCNCPLGSE